VLVGLTAITLLLAAAGWISVDGGFGVWLALVLIAAAVALPLLFFPAVLRLVARVLPVDPRDYGHQVALQGAVLLLMVWAFYQLSGKALQPSSYRSEGSLVSLLGELPLLVAALIGAGFLVRRNLPGTLNRLAIRRPSLPRVLVAVFVAEGLIAVAWLSDPLTAFLTPDTYARLGLVSDKLYSQALGEWPYWLVVGLAAGVCEETLFRGCLQPRFGLVATTILFASLHVQYGVSIFLLVIVLDGFAFGLLRNYFDTTTSVIAHATTDAIMLAPFPGWWLLLGGLAQALLIALVVWRARRRILGWITSRRGRLAAPWPAGGSGSARSGRAASAGGEGPTS
jgi:membrane protease YdiL (CAAX protease family)